MPDKAPTIRGSLCKIYSRSVFMPLNCRCWSVVLFFAYHWLIFSRRITCTRNLVLNIKIHRLHSKTEMVDPPGSSVAFAAMAIVIVCYYLIYTPMQYVGETHQECHDECPPRISIPCTSGPNVAKKCRIAECEQCVDWENLQCYTRKRVCADYVSLANTPLFIVGLLAVWGLLVVYVGYHAVYLVLHDAGLA